MYLTANECVYEVLCHYAENKCSQKVHKLWKNYMCSILTKGSTCRNIPKP